MVKTIQYVNTGLDLKTRFVWEKKKRVITSEISSILVQYSLKCGVAFSLQVIIYKTTSLIFVSWCLVKSLWKNQHVSSSMSVKSTTVGSLSKCCCQCASQLLRRNFNRIAFLKKLSWQSQKSLSSNYPFLTLLLNKKIKMNTQNIIASIPFKSQVY